MAQTGRTKNDVHVRAVSNQMQDAARQAENADDIKPAGITREICMAVMCTIRVQDAHCWPLSREMRTPSVLQKSGSH